MELVYKGIKYKATQLVNGAFKIELRKGAKRNITSWETNSYKAKLGGIDSIVHRKIDFTQSITVLTPRMDELVYKNCFPVVSKDEKFAIIYHNGIQHKTS